MMNRILAVLALTSLATLALAAQCAEAPSAAKSTDRTAILRRFMAPDNLKPAIRNADDIDQYAVEHALYIVQRQQEEVGPQDRAGI